MPRPGKRVTSALALLAVAAVAAGVAAGLADGSSAWTGETRLPGTWCGGSLWRLMTLSDKDRRKVVLSPTPTTIADIAALKPPARIVPRRTTGFQRHVWELQTVLDRYRIASNGEIVLILYSIQTGQYMNAYMPNPGCLSVLTRNRAGILAARSAIGVCPTPVPVWNLVGLTIDISGVGFWNPNRSTRGALPNGAELRPVTSLRIVAGCGVG